MYQDVIVVNCGAISVPNNEHSVANQTYILTCDAYTAATGAKIQLAGTSSGDDRLSLHIAEFEVKGRRSNGKDNLFSLHH